MCGVSVFGLSHEQKEIALKFTANAWEAYRGSSAEEKIKPLTAAISSKRKVFLSSFPRTTTRLRRRKKRPQEHSTGGAGKTRYTISSSSAISLMSISPPKWEDDIVNMRNWNDQSPALSREAAIFGWRCRREASFYPRICIT